MKKKVYYLFFTLVLILAALIGQALAGGPSDQDKRLLVSNLVNEAADLIKAKGEDAFEIIADKNGKFITQDTYVFVTSGETGADLLNPVFREVEGLPAKNYGNPQTQAAQMAIVEAVKNKDTAWVEYLWPKPQESNLSKKVAYLKKIMINGKERIVGAGFYPQE